MAACFAKAVNCDNLWRPWYIILVTCLQAYILYSGIARYIAFKADYFDPKYGGNWNPEALNFYLAMLIIASFFFCLFLYTSLTRSSNLAGEGVTLGQGMLACSPHPPRNYPWQTQQAPLSQQEGSNAGLYATANGVLGRGNLSAGLGTVGEEDGLPQFDTWSARSALHLPPSDFVGYPVIPSMFRSIMSTGGTIVTGAKEGGWSLLAILWKRFKHRFIPASSLMHIISAYAFFLALPILEAQRINHHVLPLENVWRSNLDPILRALPPNAMSVEFFNLLFAFAALALRYPAVFWRTNHCFAFTFSLILVILGIQGLLEINATEIVVKLCWNDKDIAPSLAGLCQTASSESAEMNNNILELTGFDEPRQDPEGLNNATGLFLSTVGTLTMLLLTSCIFDYGVDQFVDKLVALRRSAIFGAATQDVAPSDAASIQDGGVCGLKTEGQRSRRRAVICRRAIAVLGTLCVLAIKMPILIASGKAFEVGRQPLLLANIVATVFFFCAWYITWFAFCLKPDWKFKITYSSPCQAPVMHQSVNLNPQYLPHPATLVRLADNTDSGGPTGTFLTANGGPGPAVGTLNGGVGNTGTALRLISGSPPIYACLNDGGPAAANLNPTGLCRLANVVPPPSPPPPPPTGQVPIGQSNRACTSSVPQQQQNTDCCSVDTEGSSRQSGTNNYVCLQSSLNTTNAHGMNALPQNPSYSNTQPIEQQAMRSNSNQENIDPLSALRYALRQSEILSPVNLRFINSSPYAAQGSGEADARHLLNENVQESHGYLSQSSSTNNPPTTVNGNLTTSSKLEESKQTQPRVTFKELSEKMRNPGERSSEPCSSSNPNSSSDSGIDNHGLVPAPSVTTPTTLSSSLFATLPTVSRTGLSLSFNGSTKIRPSEPTYCNQEQMSSSSNSTPGVFECPRMPPLNLPQNEAGEVSFASLSRRFNLRTTSFEPPPPLAATSNEPGTVVGEERLMSRSVIIRRDERTNSGRLCSQV